MSERFRTQIVYFMTPANAPGVPPLAVGEYWIRRADAQQWLEDFAVSVVSPLDAEATAEIELTEEQEAWLEWLVQNDIQHVRVE
jgi:hypothetical protein